MTTREREAHIARLAVDNAAVMLQSSAWSAGTRNLSGSPQEDAALTELREALTELYSLATMSDDEFEVGYVDPTPDTQEQVTTPPEVFAR